MPSILNLKFKGNKSFVAFSNLGDTDSLTKTWKVCSKVAGYLEQGQRLENLSWRLWHLQNLIVESDNAKSKREFRKLSKCMSDKLDKEKGRSIEELQAPGFQRNQSTDKIRQRAVEKERNREASHGAKPGTIQRMQFTFSVDQQSPVSSSAPSKKPDYKPSAEFRDNTIKRGRPAARAAADDSRDGNATPTIEPNDRDPPLTQRGRKASPGRDALPAPNNSQIASLRFPSLFSNDFGPSALLYPTPTVTNPLSYGEGVGFNSASDGFSIVRPTIELPLDELLTNVDMADSPGTWSSSVGGSTEAHHPEIYDSIFHVEQEDIEMKNAPEPPRSRQPYRQNGPITTNSIPALSLSVPPPSQLVKDMLPQTVAPASTIGRETPTPSKPALSVRTSATPIPRSSGPSATATSMNPAALQANYNTAPGGAKAECSNCGATHTPLWRRGLNDELNCNACGLYCKLHKRPRPKTMRNSHGEGRAQTAPRQEPIDIMAQCYNCHTTATPLWRKDDEGKTVCNACGLYFKLHGSSRPISMKSDIIRKRSRHDSRRVNGANSDSPSASPGASRRPSPTQRSPTLAPDSTTQLSYEYGDNYEFNTHSSSESELLGALGDHNHNGPFSSQGTYANSISSYSYPGPYHPDYLSKSYNSELPFSSVDSSEGSPDELGARGSKRRRMSNDSVSEPPSSATSYSSYADAYSTQSSATTHSQRSSMDFPYGSYATYGTMRNCSNNAFWHPPMLPQDSSPQFVHPPMLPTDESPMDFLHPPMLPAEEAEALFASYLHPPMLPSEDSPMQPMSSLQPHHGENSSVYGGSSSGRSDFYDAFNRTFGSSM